MMTLDELREHIAAVLAYNWSDEYDDAKENGLDGHIFNHMLALAEFIGDDVTEERAALGAECKRCGSTLDGDGYCTDETCPHSDHKQDETWTEG